jgi:hypothetical protein
MKRREEMRERRRTPQLIYNKKKYREMILDAAETVLGYFDFDRTVYINKRNTAIRKWR